MAAEGENVQIIAELVDVVSAPAAKATASLERLEGAARKVGGTTGGAASEGVMSLADANRRLTNMAGDADRSLVRMSDSLGSKLVGGLKAAALGYAALATVVTGFGLKSAASFEQSRVAFGTLLGSVEKGNALFGQLREFNKLTPFDLPQITKTSQMLMGMGFTAESLVPTLTAVSDVSSGLGAGAEGLGRIALNLGQIKTQGKATGREIRDLAVVGVPSYALVANILGITTEQVRKLGDKASVTGEQFIDAFTKMQGPMAKFAGASAAQSKTLVGMWSNVKDAVTVSLADAFSDADGKLKGVIPGLSTRLTESIHTIGPPLATMMVMLLNGFVRVLPVLARMFTAVTDGLQKLGHAAKGAGKGMGPIAEKIGPGITKMFDALVPIMPLVVVFFGRLTGLLPDMISVLGSLLTLAAPFLALLNTFLGFGPTREIFAVLLVGLLAYSKLSSTIKTMRHFAEALELMAAKRRALTAAEQAGVGADAASGAGGMGLAGKAGMLGLGAIGAASVISGGKGKANAGKDLSLIGGGAAFGAALGSFVPGVGTLLGAGVGAGVGLVGAGIHHATGDTARPYAGYVPGVLGAAGMGGLTVTSGQRNWGLGGLGSDHASGRALDLQGPFLDAYKLQVEALGGFAEYHGEGSDRHLHAVGDTPRPMAGATRGGAGGGMNVSVNIDARGSSMPPEAMIRDAVRKGVAQAVREMGERSGGRDFSALGGLYGMSR